MKTVFLLNNEWKERVNSSLLDVSSEDAEKAQTLYDRYKIDGAELISIEINLSIESGIINCRVNNEHKQIRF